MQFYSKILADLLKSDINYKINVFADSVLWSFAAST